jgi:H+-translocating diphosphatase
MSSAILPDLATEILVPLAAIVGIVFSLVQWVLVSKVKMSPEDEGRGKNGGPTDPLIEEEEGLNDQNVVAKCAEIQNAISEGNTLSFLFVYSCKNFRIHPSP